MTFDGNPKDYCTNACPPTNITSRNGGAATATGKEGFDHLNSNLFLRNLSDNSCVANCATNEVFVPKGVTFGLTAAQYDSTFYTTDKCLTSCPTNIQAGKVAPRSIVPKINTGSVEYLLRDHCSASCQKSGFDYTNANLASLGGVDAGDTTVERCVNDCSI